MDEKAELLNLISDLSKEARGFRDRTNYGTRTLEELRAIVDDYYLESLRNQYLDACDEVGIRVDTRQVWRMNIAELEHRLEELGR